MKILHFDRALTEDDVKEINQSGDCIVGLESTLNQNPEIISKISKQSFIKVFPKEFSKHNKIFKKPYMTYSVEAFGEILNFFQKVEKKINKNWSDLEKAVYIYSEIQKLPKSMQAKFEGVYDLSAIATKNASSQGLATVFYEAMSRQNIPCKYMYNDNYDAWNEIKIGDKFYPVDLNADTMRYRALNEELKGEAKPVFDNFACNNEFYKDEKHSPCKVAELLSNKELKSERVLKKEAIDEVVKSVEQKINLKQEVERAIIEPVNIPEPIERKDIKLKSKELAKTFEKSEILANSYDGKNSVTIEITDNNHKDLIEDLEEIGKYYPEILEQVELKNESENHVSFQDVVDKIYEVKKDNPYVANENQSIKIATKNPEDFDLDFSKAPKVTMNPRVQADGEIPHQGIEFVNLDDTKPMKLPNFKNKLPENIDEITFENIDFDGVNLDRLTTGKGIRVLNIYGSGTQNINSINNISKAHEIGIKSISNKEFDAFINDVYENCTSLDKIKIKNQRLQDRKILKELSKNSNVSTIKINNSKLNDLDGLEDLNGRIAFCNLIGNDLGISDVERLEKFKDTNPYFFFNLENNSQIEKEINGIGSSISEDSRKVIADYMSQAGVYNAYFSKEKCLDALMDEDFRPIPYYAKDANIFRSKLKLIRNPMMIKDDSEIDSLDFNSTDMKDGIMLLTIPQIEYLLNSGKIIPQTVRIKIEDVTQLDNASLETLENKMAAKGMNISGVQIFDKDNNNNWEMIGPYTVENYKKIRSKLERLVEDIDKSEPDIDKFATIYMRMTESIPYDLTVIDRPDMKVAGGLRNAKYRYSARNLEEGLIEGTCVCSGYADILRNALKMVGVESKTNSGTTYKVNGGGHAWNQIRIDGKWYYADCTWDEKKSSANPKDRNYNWILLGKDEFTIKGHQVTDTKNIANVEKDKYPRADLKAAIKRNEHRSFDFTIPDIEIEEDPVFDLQLDEQKIKDEYKRRRNDMLAKYYGDKNYQSEYKTRSERFKANEIDATSGNISYRTINDYPERAEDEAFLFLDGYKNALERKTKFEAGDTSVYANYSDPNAEYEKDKEYVETRNHTFNQHENTHKDLATLGKFGEKVPYIPKRQSIIGNTGRIVANTGIFIRNIFAPVYRFGGKYIGQPIHKLITRNSDASPYRNNFYHRMVARRDYFEEAARKKDAEATANLMATASDPNAVKPISHPIRNAVSSRFKAIFNVRAGNQAVLNAGLANIKNNIRNQEGQKAMVSSIEKQEHDLNVQITKLEKQINDYPNARNIAVAQNELKRKKDLLKLVQDRLDIAKSQDTIYSEQTDAIDAKQHSIASKEVNTLRVTAIKGIAKGAAIKYFGPKIKELILNNTKKTQSVIEPNRTVQTRREWVEPTYKTEVQDVYGNVVNKSKSVKDMMASNKGNSVTGFYSVYGGERGAAMYELTGDEKITGIFQSIGNGGKGLSDTVGLQAPTLTDGTFAQELLNQSGFLNQDISIEKLVSTLNANNINLDAMQDVYVSVSDRCWVKLSDLLPGITEKVKVDELVKTVVENEGYFRTVSNVAKASKKVTKVVNNAKVVKGVNMTGDVLKGILGVDSIIDLNENLRKTNSDVKGKSAKDYDFIDEETQNIPTSKRDYNNER